MADCCEKLPPEPVTYTTSVGPGTWCSPASRRIWRTPSVTCAHPPAVDACPYESWPPCVLQGWSPLNVRSCSFTQSPASPFLQKPDSSSSHITVIVNES